LQAMTQAYASLGEKKARVIPIFITIDPERDTPERLKSYVAAFDDHLVGLGGGKEQVAAAVKAYRVYAARVEGENGAPYLMDHTSITYLMGPDGKYVTHFGHGTASEIMVEKLRKLL
ncbi:MAG: SCO family protein, partial [Alphaproteobacteria bacterium]